MNLMPINEDMGWSSSYETAQENKDEYSGTVLTEMSWVMKGNRYIFQSYKNNVMVKRKEHWLRNQELVSNGSITTEPL